jgi:signal transduction histidine kinase
MSIRTKVIGCFVAILFAFAGVSIWNYFRSCQSNARLALVNELFLPLSRQVAQIQGSVQGLSEDLRRFYLRLESGAESSTFSRMVRDVYPYLIQRKFDQIEQLLGKQDRPELREVQEGLAPRIARARALFDQMTQTADRAVFERHYTELRSLLQGIARQVEDECQRITLAAQGEAKENLTSSLVISGALVLFGILTLMLSHRALSPLPVLIQSLKKIADGDFNQSLKVHTSDADEISLLAREYNRMLGALAERDLEIQRQQKELLQAERLAAVGQLSAEVVHEIRNPLNSISLNIDWLESELKSSDPEVKKTLVSISREVERLHQITESYLVRARVPISEVEKTGVNDLLSEILEFSREEDRSRNILVETSFHPQEIYVRSDRSRLKQAFLNVFRNAREAMPRGGTLSVRTELVDNIYRIEVSDSGYGMNESTRRGTFQPFFTTKPNGTGLGLTLTKTIVEDAQGTVFCESHLGEGTRFTFQFPV